MKLKSYYTGSAHPAMQAKLNSINWHKITSILGGLCVIHCLSIPVVLVFLPALSQFFSETMEWIFIGLLIPFGLAGFLPTWLKHKNRRLLYRFGLGVLLIVSAQLFFHSSHDELAHASTFSDFGYWTKPFLTLIGAFIMAQATYFNNRHTHRCTNPNHEH